MDYRDLLTWLGLSSDAFLNPLVRVSEDWEIFRKEKIPTAISEFQKSGMAEFHKHLLVEKFRALLTLGFPFAPRRRFFIKTRSATAVDNFTEPMESFIREGFVLSHITWRGKCFLWESDFVVEHVSNRLKLPAYFNREGSKSRLGDAMTPEMGENVKWGLAGPGRHEYREIVKKLGRPKDPYSPRVRWLNPDSAPAPGSALEFHFVYGGNDDAKPQKSKRGAFSTELRHGPDFNITTEGISPLAQLVFTSEQILQPPEAWDTFFKSRVADCVDLFIWIPDSMKSFKEFMKKSSSISMWTAEKIEKKLGEGHSGYFLPFVRNWQNPISNSELRKLWQFIQIEKLFVEGMRSRDSSEKTLKERTILNGIASEDGVSRFKLTAYEILEAEAQEMSAEGFATDPSPDAVNMKAEEIRVRERYHRRKTRLIKMTTDDVK